MTKTKKKTLWGLSYQIVQCCPSPTVEPSVGRTSLNMKSYLETEYPFYFISHIQTSTDIGSALSDFWRNCVVWHWDTGHRIALHCESVNSEMSKMIKYLHCPAHPLCRSRGRQGKQLCTGFPPVTIVHDHDHVGGDHVDAYRDDIFLRDNGAQIVEVESGRTSPKATSVNPQQNLVII